MSWMNILCGFGVGVMVGITGVGGGSLMTPILVLIFGLAPATAVGTDLWFATITKIVGGSMLQSKRRVDWQVLRRLWLGSLPMSVATLWWMNSSGVARVNPHLILFILGWVLLATALALIFKNRTHAVAQSLHASAPHFFRLAQPFLTVVAGAVLGFLVTLTSVSAGALGTVMLLYLYPFRMKPARLVGTDIVHAVPLTFVAGLGHMIMGDVNLTLLGNLLLGSIPGILLGTMFGSKAPEGVLRIAIGVILVVVATKLLIA
ncbi:MAG: sulfite exporter TauE/SafE family protein [Steroidobacteraceae bacterium]